MCVQARREPYTCDTDVTATSAQQQPASTGPANVILAQFPHLAAKLADRSTSTASTTPASAARGYLTQYVSSVGTPVQQSATEFWQQRVGNSPIPLIALDMISAPASQAFVERLFSVCGMLTVGRRNRMSKSLQMRTWLKVNYSELSYLFSSAESC